MEEQQKVSWDEIDLERKGDQYFSLEDNKQYSITVVSADLYNETKFGLDKNGNPKKKVSIKLKTVDGKPSSQTWETQSWTIIRKMKEAIVSGKLTTSIFIVKKSKKGNNTEYECMTVEGGILPS